MTSSVRPLNDMRAGRQALSSLGFEIITGEGQTQRQMLESLRLCSRRLRAGGVGLFYYAVPGMQVAGRNFLLPIGALIERKAEVEYEAVDAGFVCWPKWKIPFLYQALCPTGVKLFTKPLRSAYSV